MDVYSKETNEKIGTVSDIVVDEQSRFIYLVVDLGVWVRIVLSKWAKYPRTA